MSVEYDVLIVGAGVVGNAVARELAQFNLAVAVFEKECDVSFGTSKANSGIIHAGFHSPPGSLKAKLAVRSNPIFDQLAEELGFPFERRGELMVAFSEEDLRVLQDFYQRGVDNGVPNLEIVGRDRTLEMEPNLSPDVMGALHAPSAGVICPYEYAFAMRDNAAANGVKYHLNARLARLERRDDHFTAVTDDGLESTSRFVVNAAGLQADEVAGLLGMDDFKILPRKGEEYLLDRRVGSLVSRVIFPIPTKKSKGMLVIPTVDGPVMVGPTAVDTDLKDDFSTSKEGLDQVFKHAQKMVPAIRTTDIITSFAGIRPVATGNDFIIGPTRVPGFINAAGIQSPGLTASPAIAEEVRDHLAAAGLELTSKDDFNPKRSGKITRFRTLLEKNDFKEIERLIGENPGYARLVCRCESVTEAEVVAAVRAGHVSLDGVKFATRARAGRCQGGFCTARILEIIRRETGEPFERIGKKGSGSELFPVSSGKGRTS